MGRQRSQHTSFKPGDYNEPTEPLEWVAWPPYSNSANNADGSASPDAFTVPAAQLDVHPSPQQDLPVYPYYQPPQPARYPILPPSPLRGHRGQPAGGSSSFSPPAYSRRHYYSLIPGLVGLLLLLVQLTLLARIICMLLNVQNTVLWLTLLFAASDLFVQPARWLAANINLPFLAGTQLLVYLEFLLAILAYGIFSRLSVRLLKALLKR